MTRSNDESNATSENFMLPSRRHDENCRCLLPALFFFLKDERCKDMRVCVLNPKGVKMQISYFFANSGYRRFPNGNEKANTNAPMMCQRDAMVPSSKDVPMGCCDNIFWPKGLQSERHKWNCCLLQRLLQSESCRWNHYLLRIVQVEPLPAPKTSAERMQ